MVLVKEYSLPVRILAPDSFCPLAGRLRRLELLVDLIRDRLVALIDPSGSITRKLREAPFPLQSSAPQVVWKEKEEKRREAAVGGGERGDVSCRKEVEEERGHVRPEDLSCLFQLSL